MRNQAGAARLISFGRGSMKEKVLKAFERLEKGIEQLIASGNWLEYLRFQARFRRYSFANTMLIYLQCPNATMVAGYREWQKMGRYVKKGQKGIQILAPRIIKKTKKQIVETEEGEQEIEVEEHVAVGFFPVYVFDVSQTDGKPLPLIAKTLEGNVNWYERLKSICPFPVTEEEEMYGAQGEFRIDTKKIAILVSLPEKQKTKTLLHEWAHGLLHTDNVQREREIEELEAEATAYVVGQCLGMDFDDCSFGYIANWTGKEAFKILKESGDRIVRAVNLIMNCIEEAEQKKRSGTEEIVS